MSESFSHSLTIHCPPLSGPSWARRPSALSLAKCFSTALGDIPSSFASLVPEYSGWTLSISRIFSLLFGFFSPLFGFFSPLFKFSPYFFANFGAPQTTHQHLLLVIWSTEICSCDSAKAYADVICDIMFKTWIWAGLKVIDSIVFYISYKTKIRISQRNQMILRYIVISAD